MRRNRTSNARFALAIAILSAALAVLALIAPGCASARVVAAAARAAGAPPVQPPPIVTVHATTPAEDRARTAAEVAQHRVDELQQQLDVAQRALTQAQAGERRAAQQARTDRIRAVSRWVVGVALVAMFGSLALAIFLPVGLKRWGITGVVACFAVVALGAATDAAAPWLPWIGGAVLLGGVAVGAWLLRRAVVSAGQAADHGDRLEAIVHRLGDVAGEATVHGLLAQAKTNSAAAQRAAGVHGFLEAVRGKLTTAAAAVSA